MKTDDTYAVVERLGTASLPEVCKETGGTQFQEGQRLKKLLDAGRLIRSGTRGKYRYSVKVEQAA